jgi:hypothetical protein
MADACGCNPFVYSIVPLQIDEVPGVPSLPASSVRPPWLLRRAKPSMLAAPPASSVASATDKARPSKPVRESLVCKLGRAGENHDPDPRKRSCKKTDQRCRWWTYQDAGTCDDLQWPLLGDSTFFRMGDPQVRTREGGTMEGTSFWSRM